MEDFLRGFWLVDLGSWALFLLIGIGLGRWAASKGLSGTRAFLHGTVAAAIALLGIEVALQVMITGSIRPLEDFEITLWCTLILPRMALWSVITGLITLTIANAKNPLRSRVRLH